MVVPEKTPVLRTARERAIRCYRRCGFAEEGREREAALVDGAWHADVVMGILERDVPVVAVGP